MEREAILHLGTKDLKSKLKELKLPITGKKSEMQERLILHFGSQDDMNESEVTVIENESVIQSRTSEPVHIQASTPRTHLFAGFEPTNNQENTTYNFTLKDIEESVTIYTGERNQSIKKWIAEFEDIGSLVKWNDLQKYIYAKRLIDGSAKLFVNGTQSIRNWTTLKEALLREFDTSVNSAEVHRQLRNRRKQSNETLREYLYRMIEVASAVDMDEESLIGYVIDGIKDDKANKIILYEAKTIEEFKNRLKIYEKLKTTHDYDTRQFKQNTNYNKIKQKKKKHCFNCVDTSHLSNNCSTRQKGYKGYKCFKCDAYGHHSFECRKQEGFQTKVKPEPKVNFAQNQSNMMKKVIIQDEPIQALIDTGCDLILCREDVYN